MKIKYILSGIFVLLAVSFYSCKDDDIVSPSGNSQMMRFVITTQSEEVVYTRANVSNDATLSDVYVLLFKSIGATDADYQFVSAASATTTDTSSSGYRIFFADITDEASANKFLIVANVGSIINTNTFADWKSSGKTLADIKKEMIVTLQTKEIDGIGYIIDDPKTAPMCSDTEDYSGITGTYQVGLTRATAKVTVTVTEKDANANPINTHYQLIGSNLGNMSTQGYVFDPSTNPSIPTANYAGIDGSTYSPDYMMRDSLEGKKQSEPLYAFPTDKSAKPFVIIKGLSKGIEGYHRINLYSDRKKKIYYDVQRNYHYMVNIAKITTVGYATALEAIADEDGSNDELDVDITVDDGTSQDIISNGEYYLGVSNTSLVIYSSDDLVDVPITTIKTSATAAAKASITYRTTDGTGNVIYNTDVLTNATANGQLIASIPKEVTKGEFTIRVGELARKIDIERRRDGISLGGAFALRAQNLVYGKIVSTKSVSSTTWIKMSDEATPTLANGKEEFINMDNSKKTVYLVLNNNMNMDSNVASETKTAELIMTKANDEGHTKILVYQPPYDIFIKDDPDNFKTGQIKNPYIGAFWRANEQGERVIKMQINTTGIGADLLSWDAVVVIGSEWAGLQLGGSEDPNIYTDNHSDAENYRLLENNMQDRIQGTSSDPIFRIGLRSTIASAEHRYGLVVVTTYLNGTIVSTYKIFLRQGDTPDYLFREDDGGTGIAVKREKAVKMSPYNLTDPKLGKGSNAEEQYLSHNAMPLDYYSSSGVQQEEFTKYPSQAGYFFVWNIDPDRALLADTKTKFSFTSTSEIMRAMHPLNNNDCSLGMLEPPRFTNFDWNTAEIPLAFAKKGDPCPNGYRMPSIGVVQLGSTTNRSPTNSELIQSLLYDQNAPNNSNQAEAAATMSKYTLWGYYADGFFDRLKIITTPSGSSVQVTSKKSTKINSGVMVLKGAEEKFINFTTSYDTDKISGNDVGYQGMLIFNPYNLSSLFFPATGYFSSTSLTDPGTRFDIWTTEREATNPASSTDRNPMELSGTQKTFGILTQQGHPAYPRSVRCVQLKKGEAYP